MNKKKIAKNMIAHMNQNTWNDFDIRYTKKE